MDPGFRCGSGGCLLIAEFGAHYAADYETEIFAGVCIANYHRRHVDLIFLVQRLLVRSMALGPQPVDLEMEALQMVGSPDSLEGFVSCWVETVSKELKGL